jgi:hypothetical protein
MPIKVTAFGGMMPARDPRLLPDGYAESTKNVWLYDGALHGFNTPVEVRTTALAGCKYAYRIPLISTSPHVYEDSIWLEFTDPDTTVIRSPMADDTHERYYWASPTTGPSYNTRSRILLGQSALTLGVPAPNSFPGVSASGGTGTVVASRAYVYSWVTEYGEEGAPSAPTLVTGKQDDTWSITLPPPTGAQTLDRRLSTTRIYRTITSSSGQATYFFVAEVPIGTTLYSDTLSDTLVSANDQMPTTLYTPPPTDLRGLYAMPNGITVGFRQNEIWFSEPYRPHAWPANYVLTVPYPVVGLGVFGQSVLVVTTAYPAVITGVSPSQMSQATLAALEPGISRGSIVSTDNGVFYASPNGIVRIATGRAEIITRALFDSEDWAALVDGRKVRAAKLGFAYYGLEEQTSGTSDGFVIDATDPRIAFNKLEETATTNVMSDAWTGDVLVLRGNVIYRVQPANVTPMLPYTYKSKIFTSPAPVNFSAIKTSFVIPAGSPTLTTENYTLAQDLAADQYGLVKVYADGAHVTTFELRRSNEVRRLPAGFKATEWQFEIQARVIVNGVEIGRTVKELTSV